MSRCDVCGCDDSEHNRHDRYNHSEKGRARWLRYYDKRMDDPDPVRQFMFRAKEGMRKAKYHRLLARGKREAYAAEMGFELNDILEGIVNSFTPERIAQIVNEETERVKGDG